MGRMIHPDACRYARCPNTTWVEGKGRQTSVPLVERGFCGDCWELLYHTRPETTRWKRHRPPSEEREDWWSMLFICCVEPTCPETRNLSTRVDHKAHGFCQICYPRLAMPPRACEECGEVMTANESRYRGPVCQRCYDSPPRTCVDCGEKRPVAEESPEGSVCYPCYRLRHAETCSECKRVRPVARRTDEGPICDLCYETPSEPCTSCGEERPVAKRTDEGPICATCLARQRVGECKACGQKGRKALLTDEGPLCPKCYARLRRGLDPEEEARRDEERRRRKRREEEARRRRRKERERRRRLAARKGARTPDGRVARPDACRYAGCPNTVEDPEIGLVTDGSLYRKGFCRDCWKLLYAEDAPARHPPGTEPGDEAWSTRFRRCVEPDCPNTEDGKTRTNHVAMGFCGRCYQRRARPPRTCVSCKRVGPVQGETDEGPVCASCHERPKDDCHLCGSYARVVRRSDEGPICRSCYAREHRPACARCKEKGEPAMRTDDGPICRSCYEEHFRPTEVCDLCGEDLPVASRENGQVRCHACYNRTRRETCCRCGKEGRPVLRTADGLVCETCYARERRRQKATSAS